LFAGAAAPFCLRPPIDAVSLPALPAGPEGRQGPRKQGRCGEAPLDRPDANDYHSLL